MTTDNRVFEYIYKFMDVYPLPIHMIIYVITDYGTEGVSNRWAARAIGLARVRIARWHKIHRKEVEAWEALRYVVLDKTNRPYVSYEEDEYPKLVGITTEEIKK